MVGSLEERNGKLVCKLDGERVKFEKALEDMHQEALEKERALGRLAVAEKEIECKDKLMIQCEENAKKLDDTNKERIKCLENQLRVKDK